MLLETCALLPIVLEISCPVVVGSSLSLDRPFMQWIHIGSGT